MDVSIVILNYKARGLVLQCVKTLGLYPSTAKTEIIVVDNGSQDGLGEALHARFPEVQFIGSPKNLGFAAGNNLGIRQAQGRYVIVMNPDITVRPGAIDAMVAHMDAHRDIGVLGPRLVHPDGSLDVSCYRYPTPMIPAYRRTPLGRLAAGRQAISSYLMEDYDHKETRDVDWLLGAVLMVRREALQKVGALDERYFLYFEDTDWCRRFHEAGYRVVYLTEAEMVHYHERLSARTHWLLGLWSRSTRIHLASALKYFLKWRH